MTTKKKFDVDGPEVVVLANGRFAYRAKCPWTGKNDKELFAYKFCSAAAHTEYVAQTGNGEQEADEGEQA